ncbi:receptor-type tyrosine-protein phosphatase alpha-like [Clytia hemisphaerica]|uniref:receptor-type tyrosine-protein phosphatase alpha-like n=1 Tax=Clytia hemisphaerica TaxID=252671 RepID=UPI0034D72FDA
MISETCIEAKSLREYVKKGTEEGLFKEQFQKLVFYKGDDYQKIANSPTNKHKNRVVGRGAYDDMRVILSEIEGIPGSDYINANRINGYQVKDAYIASQGPLEGTCEDMWRMCWEKNISTIVMLTQCVDQGREKCFKYWPDEGIKCYGSIEVTITETKSHAVYEFRSFKMCHKKVSGITKTIEHFAFGGWNDFQIPNEEELLTLMKNVNKTHDKNGVDHPLLVHCAAGCGRTGTFIVLHICLKQIRSEGKVDVFECLKRVREQRSYIVETQAQYEFIHKALVKGME